LGSHPLTRISSAGHVGYIERYRTSSGSNLGLETRGKHHQNLFVEASAVRLLRLNDIRHERYFAVDYATNRPNSNLFHSESFGDVDIIRFMLSDLWQAVRVITEIAGGAST
jgi:hypothetical protein